VLHIHRSVLESMLPGGAAELRDIEKGIDDDLKPRTREIEGCTVSLTVKMKRGQIIMKNIIGVLEGRGALAKQTVVVGAHYDHLGFGGPFGNFYSSRISPKKMVIHHGADDNGSGSSSIMELARRLAAEREGARRRLVFIAFSGEEINLLGSAHYVKNPLFPLENTVAMYNLDMVGRLAADEKTKKDLLYVEGTGSAKSFDALLEELNKKYEFQFVKKASGLGPSDHASFYAENVPVIFCWNYIHDDYHTPADTSDKINIPGMRKIVDFSEEFLTRVATAEQRPEFVRVAEEDQPRQAVRPRLGIFPSYEDVGNKGMLLEEVLEDGPAARAGLKSGDRIVEVEGKPVTNYQSYMKITTGHKQEGTLSIVVDRNGKRIPFKIKLD
jgi:hypothetical protein